MKNNTNNENKFTTVKTFYARVALVLLALNFCLTGYVILNMNKVTQEFIDSQGSIPALEQRVATQE